MNPAAGLFRLQPSQICPVARFRQTGLDSVPDTGCWDEGGGGGGYDARRLQDSLVRRQADGQLSCHTLSPSLAHMLTSMGAQKQLPDHTDTHQADWAQAKFEL